LHVCNFSEDVDCVAHFDTDMTNQWIWTSHPEHVWITAQINEVIHADEPNLSKQYLIDSVETPGILQKVYARDVHRVDPSHLADLDNICLMNDMHEAPLLDLLRRRFFERKIYTYTGDILVSFNPYESIRGLYDQPLQFFSLVSNALQAATVSEGEKSNPHVYQIGNRALCSLAREHPLEGKFSNQSIIISGESGAGKVRFQCF
jgi:myosin V